MAPVSLVSEQAVYTGAAEYRDWRPVSGKRSTASRMGDRGDMKRKTEYRIQGTGQTQDTGHRIRFPVYCIVECGGADGPRQTAGGEETWTW